MWPRRFFAQRYFTPTMFPQSNGDPPPVPTTTTVFIRSRRPNRRRRLA